MPVCSCFACDHFEIRTGTDTRSAKGRIIGAKTWKYDEDDSPLNLDVDFSPEPHVGTDITLHGIDAPELFGLTVHQLIFVIRTRTSIGNTGYIFSDDLDVATTLVHIDRDGNRTDAEIPFRYWLPTEGLAPSDTIDLDVFRTWVSQSDRTDAEKRNKLRGKIISFKGEKLHGQNRQLSYFACYVPQRRTWNQLSVRNELGASEELQNSDWLDSHWFSVFQPGIFSSVKGMLTGIRIDAPHTGRAGYWGNLFILIEDSALKFDIGRKSIHGRIAKIHQEHAREIFNDFRKLVSKYVAGDVPTGQTNWQETRSLLKSTH